MLPTVLAQIGNVLAAAGENPAGSAEADTAEVPGTRRPIAVGWATVDLERGTAELADLLGVTAEAFSPAADSIALGARCRVAAGILPGGLALVILEPITEGRLTAALARLGEGPATVWSRRIPGTRVAASAARPGPFGLERLVSHAPPQGPIQLLLDGPPGTIAR
jgi:hypothetical protein